MKNKILSPSLQVTFGLPVYSNANGKFVTSDNYYIVPAHPDNPDAPIIYTADIFEKSVYNFNAKLMLDVKYKRFGFLIGPTVNKYVFKFTNIGIYSDQNDYPWVTIKDTVQRKFTGLGIEFQLRYYFK